VVALAACSATVTKPAGRGQITNPGRQAGRLQCLRAHHLTVLEVGPAKLQVGPLPAGPTIRFVPTPGAAQAEQIGGLAQGAEVIGSALVYPNQARDPELKVIEDCVARGVTEKTF
jgi:hypothetical protein